MFIFIQSKIISLFKCISKNSMNIQSIQANSGRDISTKTNTNIEWEYADNTLTVTMTTEHVNLDEWRAIGFSLDRQMLNQKKTIMFFFCIFYLHIRVMNMFLSVKFHPLVMHYFDECIPNMANNRNRF